MQTPHAVTASPQVRIDTPSLSGRITLRGARIDDLYLKGYHTSTDPKSPLVELFRPEGAEHAWFAEFGWTGANVPRTCQTSIRSSGPPRPAPG